ncbi:DUF924 family protein [Rhizobium sp. Root1220]|uniref:DUF924 family protein n=1 Tax=Rhizobium sp. Root1220 TaxID=1736432 RepID=UPI0006FC40F5|nr:DUF924 family protein [Rhizobium sp. Root1220]KQV83189.1 hypothetical protein ASC90_21535 [Rhizobium sp. Root1220]
MGYVCTPEEVHDFWFRECSQDQWFKATAELDHHIRDRFRHTHLALARDIADAWHSTALARLAAVIVLDQFPRNIYRGTPLAFATDGLALREAKLAIAVGADQRVGRECRAFFYMPFEHAEDIEEQNRAAALFGALDDEEHSDYALRHRDVIAAYGRFPHRNVLIGRESTEAELEYLARPGAGF